MIRTQRTYESIGRGVKSTAIMTNEEKVKIVTSVYSNVKKLTIAQFIFNSKSCTSEQIIDHTGYDKVTVSVTIKDMLEAGLITISTNEVDRRYRIITMTETGKRLMKM